MAETAGCLLLHGFSGSPLEMTPLAEALEADGWAVASARLAGHGTSPADLAKVTWRDWVDSARDEYDRLRRRCTRIGLVGLSMGGALALYLAASARPAAVVAISTPVRVRPTWVKASQAAARVLPLVPVLVRLSPRDPAMRPYQSPYRQIALAATKQLDLLLAETRGVLPQLAMPLLLVQGRRDWVIPRDSANALARLATAAPVTTVWLPRSGHVATLDQDRDVLIQEVLRFLHAHARGELLDGTADRTQ